LFKEWDCSIQEQELSTGDVLAFYTDGITEATDGQGEEFGERSLIEALRQNRDRSCQSMLAAIVDEVRRFSPNEQNDDITAIVAKVRTTG
jgi:sigma-B regulation protein RsbU (phosphoserine phosphatase)